LQVRWPFLIAVPAGLLIAAATYFALFYAQLGVWTQSSRWAFEMNQKKRQAALAIQEPKLLLVAGSSALMGLSAQEIQRQTGYPTVNLGTHAALGPAYILGLAREVARPGDTVLLALEYELYDQGGISRRSADTLFIDYVVARDPAYVRALSRRQQFEIAMLIPAKRLRQGVVNLFRKPKPAVLGAVYSVDQINAFGDQVGTSQARRPATAPARSRISQVFAGGLSENPAGFPVLREFCAWAARNRIRVLATFPNIAHRPEYDRPEARKTPGQIRAFFAPLGVPVLADAKDSILPESEFFDTLYHLTEEAALARTRRFLPMLMPYLHADTAPPSRG
jgi:hypothetical protein